MTRLTPDQEKWIRRDDAEFTEPYPPLAIAHRRALLAEIDALRAERDTMRDDFADSENARAVWCRENDALRAELAEAERRGSELERAAVTQWIRTTTRADDVFIGVDHSNVLARLALDIERGRHRKP